VEQGCAGVELTQSSTRGVVDVAAHVLKTTPVGDGAPAAGVGKKRKATPPAPRQPKRR